VSSRDSTTAQHDRPDEIALLDAVAQAELVRRGDVSAVELVESAIDRVERLNPALNAVVTPMFTPPWRRPAPVRPGRSRVCRCS
jgi:hypothetical protein